MSALARHLTRGRVAALVAVVVAAVANVVLATAPGATSTTFGTDQVAALDSARTRLAAMLTVRHQDLEGDLAVATANTTGKLSAVYSERLRTLVDSGWSSGKVSMTSTVASAGVAGAPRDDVVDVVAVLATQVAAGDAKPTQQRFRVRATLQRVDGQWLVSALTLL